MCYVDELAKVILSGYVGKGVLAVLAVYFDDSGTHENDEVVGYSALFSTMELWKLFEKRWNALLKNPPNGKPPLKRFHMHDCATLNPKSEFAGYSRAESNSAIHDFRQIILNAEVYGATANIPITIWNKHITAELNKIIGGPEYECFNAIVDLMLGLISQHMPKEKDVALIFDRAPGREDFQKSVVEHFARFYASKDLGSLRIHGPDFESSYDFAALQAADMLAWESNEFAKTLFVNPQAKPRPHFAQLVNSKKFRGSMLDEEAIKNYVSIITDGARLRRDFIF